MEELKFSMDDIMKELINLPTDEMTIIFGEFSGLSLVELFNNEMVYEKFIEEVEKLLSKYSLIQKALESIHKGLNEKDVA